MHKTLIVPNTKILYRYDKGWQYSDDNGKNWYFTFRSIDEIRKMWPNIIEENEDNSEDKERELHGETLDEPLPDDFYEYISSL